MGTYRENFDLVPAGDTARGQNTTLVPYINTNRITDLSVPFGDSTLTLFGQGIYFPEMAYNDPGLSVIPGFEGSRFSGDSQVLPSVCDSRELHIRFFVVKRWHVDLTSPSQVNRCLVRLGFSDKSAVEIQLDADLKFWHSDVATAVAPNPDPTTGVVWGTHLTTSQEMWMQVRLDITPTGNQVDNGWPQLDDEFRLAATVFTGENLYGADPSNPTSQFVTTFAPGQNEWSGGGLNGGGYQTNRLTIPHVIFNFPSPKVLASPSHPGQLLGACAMDSLAVDDVPIEMIEPTGGLPIDQVTGFTYWNGTYENMTELLGEWDGAAIQPVDFLGPWNVEDDGSGEYGPTIPLAERIWFENWPVDGAFDITNYPEWAQNMAPTSATVANNVLSIGPEGFAGADWAAIRAAEADVRLSVPLATPFVEFGLRATADGTNPSKAITFRTYETQWFIHLLTFPNAWTNSIVYAGEWDFFAGDGSGEFAVVLKGNGLYVTLNGVLQVVVELPQAVLDAFPGTGVSISTFSDFEAQINPFWLGRA